MVNSNASQEQCSVSDTKVVVLFASALLTIDHLYSSGNAW